MMHTYLSAPNFHIPPPPDCPLVLGQILTDPKDPLYSLNAGEVVLPLDHPEISSLPAKGFSATRSQLKEGNFKVWTKLSDLFPIGVSAEGGKRGSSEDVFTIECVETTFFLPTPTYLAKSFQCEAVRSYLDGARWKKSLYIVTGIKVARGAKVKSSTVNSKSSHCELSAGLAQSGLPFSVGVGAGSKKEANESMSFESDGFLLAFEIREIKCTKKKPPSTKLYHKGAMFEAGVPKRQEDDSEFYFTMEETDPIPAGYSAQAFGPLGLSSQNSGDGDEDRFCIEP
ncbi:hypothetical protein V8C43DRAFT_290700 [Trichoderma afarasin]